MSETLIQKYGFTTKLTPPLTFRDVREKPFDIYGLYEPHEPGAFKRIPKEVADATNPGVAGLAWNTAGGRVRFSTDSRNVAIHAVMPKNPYRADHFPMTGSAGFDLFVLVGTEYRYYRTFRPAPYDCGYEQVLSFETAEWRELMIHFPLYCNVNELYIGLDPDASVDHGRKYAVEKPVVYYGSSITQGGCASHPGAAYQAMISIDTDADFINLGFSGSAKGEPAIRDYIAGLDMSVFVLDYDHNAPDVEHLERTHEPLFKAIREKHPDLPVIFVSKPDTNHIFFGKGAHTNIAKRRDVIHTTYLNALYAGDRNVYYVDGDSLFMGYHADNCTVDSCHPNDAGMFRMAERIGNYVKAVL